MRSPRGRSRVASPALALAGAVVITAAVGVSLSGRGTHVTGPPAPAGPAPTATARSAQTAGSSAIPSAQPIDSGPLSERVTDTIIDDCLSGSPGDAAVGQVHLARQTSVAGPVVLPTDSLKIVHLCRDGSDITGPPLDVGGPLGSTTRPSPSRSEPVVQMVGPATTGSGSAGSVTSHNTGCTYYQVGSDVASLQLRLFVDGHSSPWFEASIADGYTFAAASGSHDVLDDAPDLRVEDLAFDAAGHELTINHALR